MVLVFINIEMFKIYYCKIFGIFFVLIKLKYIIFYLELNLDESKLKYLSLVHDVFNEFIINFDIILKCKFKYNSILKIKS